MKESLVKQAACTHWSESTYKEDAELAYDEHDCIAITALARKVALRAFEKGAEWQEKQSPWISVEERLPEENTGVLFHVEWGKSRNGYFVGVYYGDGCWESEHRVFLPDSEIGKVSHWMPIPAFLKRDENENN